jgi:hypothetical protein
MPFIPELHAGDVPPSQKVYVVTYTHGHESLVLNDRVVMTETPEGNNVLLRTRDMTLHRLYGKGDQYVHLKPYEKWADEAE